LIKNGSHAVSDWFWLETNSVVSYDFLPHKQKSCCTFFGAFLFGANSNRLKHGAKVLQTSQKSKQVAKNRSQAVVFGSFRAVAIPITAIWAFIAYRGPAILPHQMRTFLPR
jgi:hypothetical protein